MSYEIITPDEVNLYLNVKIHTEDTKENRKIVHKIRKLVEELKEIEE